MRMPLERQRELILMAVVQESRAGEKISSDQAINLLTTQR